MTDAKVLRGWKDIAAYLHTTVKTATRWEDVRGLPVRRQPGGARDTVFAFREELDEWQRRTLAGAREDANASAPDSAHQPCDIEKQTKTGTALRSGASPRERILRVVAVVIALACIPVGAAVTWRIASRLARSPGSAGPSAESKPDRPVLVPLVRLEISRSDGRRATVGIVDGGAGQTDGPGGRPVLVLRPRLVDAGLRLEIERADGRPIKEPSQDPLVILLKRGVAVGVTDPFEFDVKWVGAYGYTKKDASW